MCVLRALCCVYFVCTMCVVLCACVNVCGVRARTSARGAKGKGNSLSAGVIEAKEKSPSSPGQQSGPGHWRAYLGAFVLQSLMSMMTSSRFVWFFNTDRSPVIPVLPILRVVNLPPPTSASRCARVPLMSQLPSMFNVSARWYEREISKKG